MFVAGQYGACRATYYRTIQHSSMSDLAPKEDVQLDGPLPGYGTETPQGILGPNSHPRPPALAAELRYVSPEIPPFDGRDDADPDRRVFESLWQAITGWLARNRVEGSSTLHGEQKK